MSTSPLLDLVGNIVPELTLRQNCNRPAVKVPLAALHEALTRLKSEPALAFDLLLTHTAVDRPGETAEEEGHFELLYQLYSTTHHHYLLVAADVPRNAPVAPTVCDLWRIAEWQEREVFDLFGIQYDNHPDLRRLFLEDDWEGYPLRKDYSDPFMLERD